MKLNADHYLAAAQERITDLHVLRKEGRYAALIYVSGVAVECLLRAYCARRQSHLSSRHDLLSLMAESTVLDFLGHGEQRKFGALLGEVWTRWKNNYRYASEDRLRAEYRRIGLTSRKKSDTLRMQASKISDAATELVAIGSRRWTSRKK